MPSRRIVLNGIEARDKLAKGANFLSDCVKSTLGPFGQNFFLEKKNQITNDGVTIAREIASNDEVENRGIIALREAAIKTNDEVGDGTTTAITLAQAIYKACVPFLAREGGIMGKKSPSDLVRQIEAERLEITDKLIAFATPIETEAQLIASARVSVEDEELGKLIGATQWELGKDGYILAEETGERTSSVERTNGLKIDNGFGTSVIINNQEKQTCEIGKTKVILTSFTMRDLRPLSTLIEQIKRQNSTMPITIIARAWTEEAVKLCLENINNGNFIYPMNAPYMDMREVMKDMQAVLGGTFYDSESTTLEHMQLSDVGYAERISSGRFSALITGKPSPEAAERIAKRVQELKEAQVGSQSDFEKKNLAVRISQLENGFATIKVGSPSEMERKRLFAKCEDAVNAVRAAFQEGTVKGAGLAFKDIAESLPDTYILKRPLTSLHEQIMHLAPQDFVIEDWVRDPVKVLRVALEKACLAASSFATAGGVIVTETPKPIDEMMRLKLGKEE